MSAFELQKKSMSKLQLSDYAELFGSGGVNLPALGANARRKDIFIEADYYANRKPTQGALNRIINRVRQRAGVQPGRQHGHQPAHPAGPADRHGGRGSPATRAPTWT